MFARRRALFTYAAIVSTLLALAAWFFTVQVSRLSPMSDPTDSIKGGFAGIAFAVSGWLAGFLALYLILVMVTRLIYRLLIGSVDRGRQR
jgi:hypothetical protein